jgi:hypothetical protein
MSWADNVKATALAALADRKTSAGRLFATTPWSEDPQAVWLTRVRPPRDTTSRFSISEPSTPTRQDSAPRG